jgi:hypothetical protein
MGISPSSNGWDSTEVMRIADADPHELVEAEAIIRGIVPAFEL